MKQLTCEMCGSTELVKQDGFFVCQTCGTKYSVEEAKKMMIEGTVEVQGTVQVDKSNEVNTLLKRAFMFIERGEEDDWEKAEEYFEKVLDIDPENPEAYLGKLLMEQYLFTIDDFIFSDYSDIESSKNYIKMQKYANKKILDLLQKRKEILEAPYYVSDGCLKRVNRNLKEITIPDSVTKIESSAFSNCTALKQINIPDSVTTIEADAFSYLSLTQITIPNSVTEIAGSAFKGCTALTQITIPNSVTEIGRNAFEGCTALTQITIPNGVKKIEWAAFMNCTSLTQITIPNTVTEIGKFAFEGCTSLTEIIIPNGVKKIDMHAFKDCTSLTQVTIPNSVTEIVISAFEGCNSLTHVKLSKHIYEKDYVRKELARAKNLNTIEFSDGKTISVKVVDGKLMSANGCYVATCVYGSYDCPQVWTLRRFRDDTLGSTWYGRAFIRTYYAISPTLVKWFGNTNWFKNMWKGTLDRMVKNLEEKGVENTPYEDKKW